MKVSDFNIKNILACVFCLVIATEANANILTCKGKGFGYDQDLFPDELVLELNKSGNVIGNEPPLTRPGIGPFSSRIMRKGGQLLGFTWFKGKKGTLKSLTTGKSRRYKCDK